MRDPSRNGKFKKSLGHFQPDKLIDVYKCIERLSSEFPIETLCNALEVSRNSYYEWKRGNSYKSKPEVVSVQNKVIHEFWEHKRRYGAKRITASLHRKGIQISLYKSQIIMHEYNLKAIQPR